MRADAEECADFDVENFDEDTVSCALSLRRDLDAEMNAIGISPYKKALPVHTVLHLLAAARKAALDVANEPPPDTDVDLEDLKGIAKNVFEKADQNFKNPETGNISVTTKYWYAVSRMMHHAAHIYEQCAPQYPAAHQDTPCAM